MLPAGLHAPSLATLRVRCSTVCPSWASVAIKPGRQVEKKKADAKREGEAVRSEQRGREVCQRRLNRAELEARQLAGELPGLQAAVASLAAALVGEQNAAEREAAEAARLQGEVAGMVEQVASEKKLVRAGVRAGGCRRCVCAL